MDALTYKEFEKILATTKDLVKATNYLFSMIDTMEGIEKEIYVNIIMLHNKAIDYIEAMEELKNKEEN